MREIIRLEPVFKQMVWGGTGLKDYLGLEILGEDTGEAWVASAHPQGDCRVAEGRFAGKTLSWLWKEHRELFGEAEGEAFPLLVKFIDAKEDLSIQVHPDDAYARVHEDGARGKYECWYILDCKEGADIIVGHKARTKEELEQMISREKWEDLLNVRPIHPGDFFQIPPGTVHAIRKGTLLIEIQQNSAVTYRLYDYGRMPGGKPRALHLAQAMDVIGCPYTESEDGRKTFREEGYDRTFLTSCPFFTVEKYTVRTELPLLQDAPFLLVCAIDGEGIMDGVKIKKGDCVLLPAGYGTAQIRGSLSIVTAHI